MSKFQHYYLVAAKVIFTPQNQVSAEVEALDVNTTIVVDENRIRAKDIGKAQQAAQVTVFKRIGVEIEVVDVFIASISYLGRMTQEQFISGVSDLEGEEVGHA